MVSIDEGRARTVAPDQPSGPSDAADLRPPATASAPAATAAQRGRTVFFSYNRENATEATQLRDWLRDEGLDVFMDNVHLIAGETWLQRLQQEVAQARAVLVLMRREGPRGFVLDEVSWCLEHRAQALALKLPAPGLFPVCLGEVPDVQALDPRVRELLTFQVTLWPPGQAMPTALLAALRALLPVEHFAPQQCPFRGLATFEESDAEWFFGRKREVHEVIDGLGSAPGADGTIDRAAPGHRRYTLISGDSGSGKSSLLRAGILPLLRAGALWPRTGLSSWRAVGPLRPGARPLVELERAFDAAFDPAQPGQPARVASGRLKVAGGDGNALVRWLAERQANDSGVLLIVDQMEELLQSSVDERERQQFSALLATALEAPGCPLYVIGTLRADALAELDTLLPELVRARNRCGLVYTLPRITESGLRLSIEEPARRAGVDVSEVAELILSEAQNEPGALALVQHALWSLWRTQHRRGPVTRLLRRDHEAAGGLAGMLSRDADAALAAVKAELGSDAGALQLLRQLTWVGAEDRLFRRRLSRSQAEWWAGAGERERGARVIGLLSGQSAAAAQGEGKDEGEAALAARLPLLVTGNDGGAEAYVELVHEMLLRTSGRPGEPARPHWQRLYEFIQRHLSELKLEQRLRADVQTWRQLRPWQRWRRLASFKEQRQYARLPRSADAATRRYLNLSRSKSGALVAALGLPLAYLAVGSAFVFQQSDIFPINYATRLPLWALGLGAVPEFVRLPGASASFDFGCDPTRDTVGKQACPGGTLPLQAAFNQAIRCDMGRHEVSFEQYDRYVFSQRRAGNTALAYPAPLNQIRGTLPVMEVSRAQAQVYAEWLSARSQPKRVYRLPLEWEWEYAARAGSSGPYPWGSDPPAGRANYDNEGSTTPAAWPVTSGQPNAFGLYNMVGNVSEWVADDADPATAPMNLHVSRGGYFGQTAASIRVATRQVTEPDRSGDSGTATNIGFRLCRER